MSYRNPGS